MVTPYTGIARGILHPGIAAQKFQITRYSPAADIAPFVERYWIIRWDLRGQAPYMQENIPYPCVNMVIGAGQSSIFGISTHKYVHELRDTGKVFGVKFKPGGFYPFLKSSVAHLTNQSLSVCDVFGMSAAELESALLALDDDAAMVMVMEQFLRAHLPEQDVMVAEINRLVDLIMADRQIKRVDDLAQHSHLSKRTLQRLFREYVGVSPKWVIQRYRLHEVAELLAAGAVDDWAALAVQLGYFDQAHFIKDFKAIVGVSPTEYARQQGEA
jgi:AraC-like DNA-binding protein